MSCWGLHADRNDIFDACMRFPIEANEKCPHDARSENSRTPLALAVGYLNEAAVRTLLARGANAKVGHLIHQLPGACATEVELLVTCKHILEMLVRQGAPINDLQRGDGAGDTATPFRMYASIYTQPAWLEALLAHGADINAKDERSCTALDQSETERADNLRFGHQEKADKEQRLTAFLKARGGTGSLMCPVRKGIEALPWFLCIFGGCSTH